MNTTVTATGMQVKAVAEDGLLINYVTTVGDSALMVLKQKVLSPSV